MWKLKIGLTNFKLMYEWTQRFRDKTKQMFGVGCRDDQQGAAEQHEALVLRIKTLLS